MGSIHKYLVVPLALLGLSLAFMLICLLVAVTGGRPAWVSRKLRVGALIFTLQGFSGVTAQAMATCYERPPPPSVVVDDTVVRGGQKVLDGYEGAGAVEVLLLPAGAPEIPLHVLYGKSGDFSYQLLEGNRVLSSGSVQRIAGEDWAASAPAVIQLAPVALEGGVYLLKLYFRANARAALSDRDLYKAYGLQVQ